ncbi:hypothetical protein M0802_012589 [Mischocyttarus mexicanus]|nr:hypothetical protein M0802_012589 [Mischocyttarus mexicanus]
MCLAIASNKFLSDPLRIKAISFISLLARVQKRVLLNRHCNEHEDSTAIICATQTLDTLSLHFPSEKLIQHMFKHIKPGLRGTDIYAESASHLFMTVIPDGCSEHIRCNFQITCNQIYHNIHMSYSLCCSNSLVNFFAFITKVMRKEVGLALLKIVDYAINSIRSSEGIVTYFKEDKETAFLIYENLSEETADEEDIQNTDNEKDEDKEDVAGYSVENSYVKEREEAIIAIKEIAQYTEEAFLPYLKKSFKEVYKLINNFQEDI